MEMTMKTGNVHLQESLIENIWNKEILRDLWGRRRETDLRVDGVVHVTSGPAGRAEETKRRG